MTLVSSIAGCLHLEHARVVAAERHELAMTALFGDAAAFEDDDPLGHSNRGKSMRYQQRHLSAREVREPLKYFKLGPRVEGRCGLVENQKLRIPQVSTGQCQLLPFSPRQIDSPFEVASQQLVVTSRQTLDDLVRRTPAR